MTAGIAVGVVLATVGSVAALNGWFTSNNVPSDTLTRGLVGYWPMDEGSGTAAYDTSDNNNIGILSGPSWGGSTTTCKIGGCLSFDGTNDYVDAGNAASLDITNAITIEGWIKLNAIGAYQEIASKISAAGIGYSLRIDSNNKISFVLGATGAAWGGTTGNTALTAGVWYNVAAKWDGNNIKVYLNGADDTVGSPTQASVGTVVQSFTIGEISYGGDYFNGLIDEVRVYNRALSAEEVRYHYNRGGPVGQWKFDEGEGRTAYDSTDNNNDGTLVLAGSATSSAWVAGNPPAGGGSALSFDGVDDYVSVADNNIFSFTDGSGIDKPFSVGIWIKLGDFGSAHSIVSKYSGGTGNPTEWLLIYSASKIGVSLYLSDESATIGKTVPFTSVDYLNKWVYVTFTYDGSETSNGIKIYLDGAKSNNDDNNSGTYTGMSNTAVPLRIGARFYNGTVQLSFNGLLDDARIYNYVRTAEEIRLDYNAGFAAKFGPSTADCKRDPGSCMTQGLVGYWPMDEGNGTVAYDSSSYASHGTLDGPAWTKGKVGGALSFDGSNDRIPMDNTQTNILYGWTKGTVELWLNPGEFIASREIWSKNGVADSGLYVNSTGGQIQFHLGFVSGGINLNSVANLSVNTWYHIVTTFDSSGMKIYINGVLDNSNTNIGTTESIDTFQFNLGSSGTAARFFKGIYDEPRTYNRALSAEEVRYHYNKGGPVAQWSFNEGEGRTAYDSTDNNNDGTLNLAPSGNTATSSAWVSGKYGSALSFDGVDDYVNIPAASSINDLTAFTYNLWIKQNSQGSVQKLLDKNWKRIKINANGTLQTDITAATVAASTVTTNTIIPGVWTHVVMTYNDSGDRKARFYINGVEASYSTQTSASGALSSEAVNALTIGTDSLYFFNGLIDDARIYNYARTPEEIRLDYNAGFAALFGPQTDCNRDPGSCMTNGLVGYWNMDEGSGTVAYDTSDNNNIGILSGPSWGGSTTTCKIGGCLTFDGTNDYVDAGGNSSFDLQNALTIEAWIYPYSVAVTGSIAGNIDAAGDKAQYLFRTTNTGYLNFYQSDTNSLTMTGTSQPITVNAWQHIVVVRTSTTGTITLYRNGIADANIGNSTVLQIPQDNERGNTTIGRFGSASGQYFNGLIDEVRVYNRALSAEEIRYHYNRGGPVAQWSFNEGEGRTAYDSTDNNNDGTLQLAPAGNTATSSAWVAGNPPAGGGSALNFDGVDDYVNITDTTGSILDISGSMSLGAWVYPRSFPSSDAATIITKSAAYYMSVNTSGQVQAYLDGTANQGYHAMNTALTLNKWNYVFWTYDGSSVKLYLNGVLDKAVADSGSISTNNWIMGIGAEKGAGAASRFFNGLIDDVRIYNYARTPAQILQDYNGGLSARFR